MPGALANLELIKDMDPDVYDKVSTSFKNCESGRIIYLFLFLNF